MSFLAPKIDEHDKEFIMAQSPVVLPATEDYLANVFDIPVINVGPWGREYHQWGERVHAIMRLKPCQNW